MNWYLFIGLVIVFLVIGWFSTSGVKSQWIRLGDVFIFGPILLCAAFYVEPLWLKISLVSLGASTMAYNARNWLHENKPRDQATSHPAS